MRVSGREKNEKKKEKKRTQPWPADVLQQGRIRTARRRSEEEKAKTYLMEGDEGFD